MEIFFDELTSPLKLESQLEFGNKITKAPGEWGFVKMLARLSSNKT